jgi:hypothetical protein
MPYTRGARTGSSCAHVRRIWKQGEHREFPRSDECSNRRLGSIGPGAPPCRCCSNDSGVEQSDIGDGRARRGEPGG